MTSERDTRDEAVTIAQWPFPTAAALGSAARALGIEREIRARLPFPDRKRLSVEEGRIRLRIPEGQDERLAKATRIVEDLLARIDALPVLPGEAEEILTMAPRERQKWTKDGRLQSAGTRTVKLRGRARAVTFHVFDPRHIEDVLDRDLPTIWREEDAEAAAERRRLAAAKAARTRAGRGEGTAKSGKRRRDEGDRTALEGWETFAGTGLLR